MQICGYILPCHNTWYGVRIPEPTPRAKSARRIPVMNTQAISWGSA
jgi:hypothetical protein